MDVAYRDTLFNTVSARLRGAFVAKNPTLGWTVDIATACVTKDDIGALYGLQKTSTITLS